MAVALSEILQEQHVTLDLRAETRNEALREIVATMKLAEQEKFLVEILAREEAHSTYMGNGVAFPHARTDLVQQIVLGIGRSQAGLIFGPAGDRAHLLFLIAVPRRMVNDYLVFVGGLARVASDAETRDALMNSQDRAEFIELIRAAAVLVE